MDLIKKVVPFSNSRVFITLMLHLMFAVISSFIPPTNYGFWLKINIVIAFIFATANFEIWVKYKADSKRYFSLHSLVMLIGLGFYTMSPMFKGLYPTIFFWILLIVTLGFVIIMFINYKFVAKAFLNTTGKCFKKLVILYSGTLLLTGGTLLSYMLATQFSDWEIVAVLFYLFGLFFFMVAPAMLITPEQAKAFELEE